MCLDPDVWEECYQDTLALSYEQLIDLDQHYQQHGESSIDDEFHHIVKLVMKEKATQIKSLEKSLFLSASKKNLFLKLGNIVKSVVWFFSRKDPYKYAKRDAARDDVSPSCFLPVDDVWNL